jgi:TldD protein
VEREIEKVLELPARFIDLTLQESQTTRLVQKDGTFKDLSFGRSSGFGIRVLEKTWGFASSNRLEDLLPMAERALRMARRGEAIEFQEGEAIVDAAAVTARKAPQETPTSEKRELLDQAYDQSREFPQITSTSFLYLDSITRTTYLNSEGSRIEIEIPRTALYLTLFARENGRIQMGAERMGGTGGLECLEDPAEGVREAGERAVRLLGARGAPGGRFQVVLDPRLTGVFFHEALGHAVEADHVLQGESILEGKLGERIGSELVTLYDDPTLEGAFGYYPYDSEGTPARRKTLLEGGVLRSYLHSRETASLLGQEETGNARAQGCNHMPIVRMSNTYLQPKDLSFQEIVEEIKEGIYLVGSRGGEVDPARGVFQFSAEEGFLIEKGRVTAPLRDVSLSGETLDILQKIDAVGEDFGIHIGFCGKASQKVPVGDGGPHIRTYATVGGV